MSLKSKVLSPWKRTKPAKSKAEAFRFAKPVVLNVLPHAAAPQRSAVIAAPGPTHVIPTAAHVIIPNAEPV